MKLITNQLWILIYLVYATEGSKEQSKGISHFYRIREEGGSGSSTEGEGSSAFFSNFSTWGYWRISGNYMLRKFWKLYAGKSFGNYMLGNLLETICWEIFWKQYARKFFGNNMLGNFLETICWEPPDGNYVLGNLGGCRQFLKGVIME